MHLIQVYQTLVHLYQVHVYRAARVKITAPLITKSAATGLFVFSGLILRPAGIQLRSLFLENICVNCRDSQFTVHSTTPWGQFPVPRQRSFNKNADPAASKPGTPREQPAQVTVLFPNAQPTDPTRSDTEVFSLTLYRCCAKRHRFCSPFIILCVKRPRSVEFPAVY